MFHEYALDPAVLHSWERARYFLDAFGPWKGRFLARYPKDWKKRVYRALGMCPDVEKKKIVERLARLPPEVFYRRKFPVYDDVKPWLDNAELEHQRLPFRAIISDDVRGSHILDPDNVDESHELWRVESGQLVARDPAVLAAAVRLLLSASRQVLMVDPYFRADQDDKTQPFAAFCRIIEARALAGDAAFEVHFANHDFNYDDCMRHAERALPRVLPIGMSVTLRCWEQRAGGQRLHNRYLITDIGGVKFGDSIEMGDAGEQDHLSILDEPSRRQLWDQYLGPTPAFTQVGVSRTFIGRRR